MLSYPLPLVYGQKPSLNDILRLQSDCVYDLYSAFKQINNC